MYRLVYTARVRPAKEREAYQRAKEFAQYVSIKYSPFSIDAYSEVFGDIATVHLCADFEELATYERAMAQGATDVEFEATERKLVEWIIEGTEHETLLRSLQQRSRRHTGPGKKRKHQEEQTRQMKPPPKDGGVSQT